MGGLDALDFVVGNRRPMTPTRLQNERIGGHDFVSIGRDLLATVQTLTALQPHHRILDLGCGYGRLAVPLTTYLERGEYCGFDIDRRAIRWCQREISSRYPNFWFAHVDVANSYYNRHGAIAPEAFRFPCADQSMDVVVGVSLFTHLLPDSAARYIAEISRVLKPGACAAISFFTFDDISRTRVLAGNTYPRFEQFPEAFYAITSTKQPELGIAYDETFVRDSFAAANLQVIRIERGSWAGGEGRRSFQDFALAVKAAD
jgi:SAM-dependent methyltransferase